MAAETIELVRPVSLATLDWTVHPSLHSAATPLTGGTPQSSTRSPCRFDGRAGVPFAQPLVWLAYTQHAADNVTCANPVRRASRLLAHQTQLSRQPMGGGAGQEEASKAAGRWEPAELECQSRRNSGRGCGAVLRDAASEPQG
jgi:hypothetical protein